MQFQILTGIGSDFSCPSRSLTVAFHSSKVVSKKGMTDNIMTCGSAGLQVSISVQDTGCGIPAEQHELIFDAFNQVSNVLHTASSPALLLHLSQALHSYWHALFGFRKK